MRTQLQVLAVVASALLLVLVIELVRRRRLVERYALVWLGGVAAVFVLSVWSGLLRSISSALGIHYPPSALFLIAVGFAVMLLLHHSVTISRLSDQTKVLAQRLALLEERTRAARARAPGSKRENGHGAAEQAGDERLQPTSSPPHG
jgi:hypothetical protein